MHPEKFHFAKKKANNPKLRSKITRAQGTLPLGGWDDR